MKNIYLIRHCSTKGQHIDSPLSTEGIRQAEFLAQFLIENANPIDKIVSSPYLRAIESIKPFSKEQKIKIDVDSRLSERIISNEPIDDWLDEVEQSFLDLEYTLPGGESGNQIIDRSIQLIEEILQNDDIKNTVIITHRNLLSLILKHYDDQFGFNDWKKMQTADIYVLTYKQHEISSIEKLNKK